MKRPFSAEAAIIILLTVSLCSCSSSREADITRLLAPAASAEETFANTAEAYRLYPDDTRVRYNYAYMLLSTGDTAAAMDIVEESLVLEPESLRFHYLKAAILRTEGRLHSYEEALGDILAFDPGNTEVRERLIQHHWNLFHKDKAVAEAEALIERDPANELALSVMASTGEAYWLSLAEPPAEELHSSDWDIGRPADSVTTKSFRLLADEIISGTLFSAEE